MIQPSQEIINKLKAKDATFAAGDYKWTKASMIREYPANVTNKDFASINANISFDITSLAIDYDTGTVWISSYSKSENRVYIHKTTEANNFLTTEYVKHYVVSSAYKSSAIVWDKSFNYLYPRAFILDGTVMKEWNVSTNAISNIHTNTTLFDVISGPIENTDKGKMGGLMLLVGVANSAGNITLSTRTSLNGIWDTVWNAVPKSSAAWTSVNMTLNDAMILTINARSSNSNVVYLSVNKIRHGSPIEWQPRINSVGPGDMFIYDDWSVHELYLSGSAGTAATMYIRHYKSDIRDLAYANKKTTAQFMKTSLDANHPIRIYPSYDGYWYGLIKSFDGKVRIVRYRYGTNISSHIQSYDINHQIDNPVSQLNMSLIDPSDISNPKICSVGSMIRMKMVVTSDVSKFVQLGVFYIDELEQASDGVISLSARNATGKYLKDIVLSNYSWPIRDWWIGSTMQEILTTLFKDYSYYYNIHLESSTRLAKKEDLTGLLPSTQCIAMIEHLVDLENGTDIEYKFTFKEDPYGTIYVQRATNYAGIYPIKYFTFNEADEMFSKTVKINADDAAAMLLVECQNADFNNSKPESGDNPRTLYTTLTINNYPFIQVDSRKCTTISPPRPLGYSDPGKYGIKDYAQEQLPYHHFMGVNVELEGMCRPEVQVGDIAKIKIPPYGEITGTINSVTHSFDCEIGTRSKYSIASGGRIIDSGGVIYNDQAKARTGSNRMQRVSDIIKLLK